ncbi:unnamed protein product [Ostreobium quekettii]|uniref:Uncharacterized protein n=1 Tax=Ostreobium quekettii TaxID=121088 RepID=A0A8S1J9J6_9CHLO|nr:unnamed protein product [Ostreobium quekettii]
MDLSVMSTMVFAIIVSAMTMLHWLAEPSRPMLHVVFVAFFLLVIMGATAFFHKIYGWTNMASSIIGAVVGGLLSTGLYAAARTAWGLWCQGGRVEEDPEAHMGYADTQPAWRQHSNPR